VHTSTRYIDTEHIENGLLRDLIEQVKSERDDLRKRLNDTEESRQRMQLELQRLTLLLTHQTTTKTQIKKTNTLFNKIFKC
jgi:regulator of replication initiation timing